MKSILFFSFIFSISTNVFATENGTCTSQLEVVKAACKSSEEVRSRCQSNRAAIGSNKDTSEATAGNQTVAQEKMCKEEIAETKQYCEAQTDNANRRCAEEKKIAEETKKMAEESKKQSEAAAKIAAEEKKDAETQRERAIRIRDSSQDPGTQRSASNTAEQKHAEAVAKMNQENAAREDAQDMEKMRAAEASRIQQITSVMKQIQELANGGRRTSEAAKAESDASEYTGEQLKSNFGSSEDSPTTQAKKSADSSGSAGNTQGQGGSGASTNQQGQKSQDQAGGSGGGMPSIPSMGGSGSSSSPVTVNEKQDCSNASFASSNPVCACRLNPMDSRCGSILAADKQAQAAKKAAKMYDGEEGGGKGFATGGGGYADPKEKNISQHGQLAQGAGGSVGKGVGSGQGSHAANDPRESKSKSYRDQFGIKGGSARGGSGGGGSYGGGSSSQPNSRIPSTFANALIKTRAPSNVASRQDLRNQMQMQFNNRRRDPAGVVGPDGITGKHSDQFKKIRIRYAELLGI